MLIPGNYQHIILSLKEKIRNARLRATISLNKELFQLYWEIGHTILQQQQKEGWGSKVIDKLSQELLSEFPEMRGLSVRNLKYMRAFAEAWPGFGIVQTQSAQMQPTDFQDIEFVLTGLAQLTINSKLRIQIPQKTKPGNLNFFRGFRELYCKTKLIKNLQKNETRKFELLQGQPGIR